MKILIAVPTFENIYPDTFKALWGLERGGNEVLFTYVRGYDCATARNRIADEAIREKADYVLMVDNDTVLPADALVNLLSDNKDVCLGYYPRRGTTSTPGAKTCMYKLGEHSFITAYTMQEMKDARDKGTFLIHVHGGGMGCALIKTEVFTKLKFPYFDWVNYKDRNNLSEDLYFCKQCGDRNIPVYVDTRVMCGHMMRYIQWPL